MLLYIVQEIFLNKELLLCVTFFPHDVAPVYFPQHKFVCVCVYHSVVTLCR